MRRHGWGGHLPADDQEAVDRIVGVARQLIEEHPTAAPGIAEVAERLSITRQTVYRYFPSSQALVLGAVEDGIGAFVDEIVDHLAGRTDPADATAELVAFAYDSVRRRPDLALLLAIGGTTPSDFTGPIAADLGRSLLERLDVDWAAHGFDDERLDEFVELLLRLVQSFVFAPGDPPWRSDALRSFVVRWLGPTLSSDPPSTR